MSYELQIVAAGAENTKKRLRSGNQTGESRWADITDEKLGILEKALDEVGRCKTVLTEGLDV